MAPPETDSNAKQTLLEVQFPFKRFHFNSKLKSSSLKPIAEAKPNKHENTKDQKEQKRKKNPQNPSEGNIFIPRFRHNTIAHYYDRKNSLCPLGTDSTLPYPSYRVFAAMRFSFLYITHLLYRLSSFYIYILFHYLNFSIISLCHCKLHPYTPLSLS